MANLPLGKPVAQAKTEDEGGQEDKSECHEVIIF
jgi:hypothetical protein